VAALRRVGGRTEFYLSLLRRFADGQEETARAIDTAIKAGDRATAQMRAHALRGMAANLGAIDVQDSAAAVEEALSRETPAPQVSRLLAALAGHLDPLVQELKARIPSA
jgi:HPt (histidine-containing phosphotransfer) domain-containing protein